MTIIGPAFRSIRSDRNKCVDVYRSTGLSMQSLKFQLPSKKVVIKPSKSVSAQTPLSVLERLEIVTRTEDPNSLNFYLISFNGTLIRNG